MRQADGRQEEHGHRNHMRAINAINHCGNIKGAVESGRLTSGVMYECVKNNVPFVLAGSLRDDGPLPDTITDMNVAQDLCAQHLKGAGLVLCLGSMLHSIAIGNMSPSWVKIVCVDINPAVATKVSDRGTGQADRRGYRRRSVPGPSLPGARAGDGRGQGMKREYTDEQAIAGIDATLPEIETWPNHVSGLRDRDRDAGVHFGVSEDGLPDFGKLTLRYVPDKTVPRTEVAEDVYARVPQSRHFLRKRDQPVPAGRRERMRADKSNTGRRLHSARRHPIEDYGELEQGPWLRRLTAGRMSSAPLCARFATASAHNTRRDSSRAWSSTPRPDAACFMRAMRRKPR